MITLAKLTPWTRAGLAIWIAAALSGCAARPPVKKVVVETPAAWRSAAAEGVSARTGNLDAWWETFHDAQLTRLIERALPANLDVRIAVARVAEARAQAGVADAARRPTLNAGASAQRLRGGLPQGVGRVANLPGISSEIGIFQVGFDAGWELDFFGGARLAALAAREDARAAEEALHGARVMTAAETARYYIELRGAQQRLAVVRRQLDLQRETYELARSQAQAGLAPELDAVRALGEYENLRAAVPPLEAAIEQAAYRLGVLVGTPPGALVEELSKPQPIPPTPPEIPVGLPSDLLQRRPDIRRAEAELAATLARLGAARTDLFPKFALTGSVGRQGTSISGLTLGAGNFFAVGPSVRLPLLTGGRIRANIAARDAQTEQAALRYEQVVLEAFEEVERALVGYLREGERRAALDAALRERRDAAAMAQERYARGIEDFTSVLDARRAELAAEEMRIESETRRTLQAVALYKALGGGW